MTLIAASGIGAIVPILLVLACPLMMVFMMRGMHGGHAHDKRDARSLDELKRERDRLNERIAERAEQTTR